MTAIEQLRAEKKVWRLTQLLIGLVGYGASLTVLLHSVLGASSWNVLAEGLAHSIGITFGWATNLIAVAVLVFWFPLRELPGLGTFLNVILVGLSADAMATVLPVANSLIEQVGYFAVGLLMMTCFDAVYLGARFGSGPRDGLMTGAVRLTNQPVWVVRGTIEIVVVAAGWLLGGTAGVGTLVIALASGPLIQTFLAYTTVGLRSDTPSHEPSH